MTAHDTLYDTPLAEWPCAYGKVFRLELKCFQGRPVFSWRIWYRDGRGVLQPSKDGITTSVVHLPALLDALAEAYRLACAQGWLEREG